jgi:alcohol dehydrogenase (cytochrome c)
LQWSYRITEVGAQRGAPVPVIKATPLLVDGTLYFTIPNNIYAVDARTGAKLWSYSWVDQGGHLVGNRGLGMYKNWLYFLGPDDWVICLDANTGKERWRKQIADARLQYFTTTAPLVIKNHVLVGVGGDAMDIRGFLVAMDPDTGEIQWKWDVRSGFESDLLGDRQHQSGVCGPGAQGCESLHGQYRGAQPGYRQVGVALPGLPARYP